jgi:hypothetical protein
VRKRALVACAVACAIALVGCKAEITAHVVIVGDSITSESVSQIADELTLVSSNSVEGRYLVTPNAVGGIGVRTVPGQSNAAAYWDVHLASVEEHASPEVWIIALGTNDCFVGDWDGYGASIDFVMSRLPEAKPVFWVNLWSRRAEDVQCVADVNAALDDAVFRWPDLTVIDAMSTLGSDPANYSDDRHPSEQGKAAYAQLLRTSLDQAFAGS